MRGGVQWASASVHQRRLDWDGLPKALKGSLPFIPPGLPFTFCLHGHQATQLETVWKFQQRGGWAFWMLSATSSCSLPQALFLLREGWPHAKLNTLRWLLSFSSFGISKADTKWGSDIQEVFGGKCERIKGEGARGWLGEPLDHNACFHRETNDFTEPEVEMTTSPLWNLLASGSKKGVTALAGWLIQAPKRKLIFYCTREVKKNMSGVQEIRSLGVSLIMYYQVLWLKLVGNHNNPIQTEMLMVQVLGMKVWVTHQAKNHNQLRDSLRAKGIWNK